MNTAVAPDRQTAPGVAIEWLRDLTKLPTIAREWKDLERSVEFRTHLSTYDFITAWYQNYAGDYGGVPLIGLAWRDARLIGVAPLTICRGTVGRIPVTRIEFAPSDCPAGEFLIKDDQPELAAHFIDMLARDAMFDVISLDGFAPESRQLIAVQHAAARNGMAAELVDHAHAVADLSDGYEKYRASLSGQFRRKFNQKARRMADAGPASVEANLFSMPKDQIERAVARIIDISERSYKLDGASLSECHRTFLADLVQRLSDSGTLCLPILSIGREDAAFVLGVVDRGVFYDVSLAYAEKFEKFSPGSFLMQQTLETLASHAVHTVVSHGAHEYKRHWSTRFVPQKRIFLFRPGLRSRIVRFIRFSLAPMWESVAGGPEAAAGSR
jgi:CelD/BcsL family acetyltransferase involved in cellulose biosynthesis